LSAFRPLDDHEKLGLGAAANGDMLWQWLVLIGGRLGVLGG
jgi:hypothetical protein